MSTRARWLCLALALPFLSCGPAPGKDAGVDDLIPPTIASTSPTAGASSVELQVPIMVTFSEVMAAGSISITTTPSIAFASPSLDDEGLTATAVPQESYAGGTLYTVMVAGKDLAGNSLTGLSSFSFTTKAVDQTAPTVTSTTPANAATDVALTSTVSATFSEPMDFATVTVSLSPGVDLGTPTWNGEATRVDFTPTAPLAATTVYTLAITGDDLAGNALAPVSFSFTTGTPPDTTPPTVGDTVPANGDTGVSNNTMISITFSEPMQQTATEGAISLVAGSTLPNCNGRWLWNGARTMASCQPDPVLAFSTNHTVTISVAAKDDAGNALAAPVSFSFTIGSAPDTTPPTISSVTPADAAKGIERSAYVEIVFSEAMDTAATQGVTSCAVGSTNVGGTFAWSNRNRTLRFVPTSSFSNGVTVSCRVRGGLSGARDVAGNRLAADKTWSFLVLRLGTLVAPPIPALDGYFYNSGSGNSISVSALVGDNAANLSSRSFVAFSIAELPTSTRRVTSAVLYLSFVGVLGNPSGLGSLLLEQIDVGTSLTSADYASSTISTVTWSPSLTTGTRAASVVSAVNDDLSHRTARGNRTATRLRFTMEVIANGSTDGVVIATSEYATESLRPRLVLMYEYP